MFKWISLGIVLLAIVLYFTGALSFDNGGSSVNISVDKDKAQDLGKSLKEKLTD